ncbi:MAG: TrbC/VirB2 family protein [Alphaproteobacteria bacterium]
MISVNKLSIMWKACIIVFFALSLLVVTPVHEARADDANKNKISERLCNVVKLVTGGVGKAISVLIIITLAIALFLGKVSWGMAIAVAVGMGIMFGAPGIVSIVSGDTTNVCDTATTPAGDSTTK